MSYCRPYAKRGLWILLGCVLAGGLAGCEKTQKQTTAGGGASSQSVLSIQGAPR